MINKKELARKRRHHRIRAKVTGTAERPRLVVHRSLKFIRAQIINDATHEVIVSVSDVKQTSKGTKTDRAAKVGTEIAKLAQEKKVKKVVFDRTGRVYHGRIKALAEAAREAGLDF